MIRIMVQFDESEATLLRHMARGRQVSKDAVGIRDGSMLPNGYEAHLLGLAGEVAVCQLTGARMDAAERLGGDDGEPDLLLPDGRTIEVKTRRSPGYAFVLPAGQTALRADIGVLAWLHTPVTPGFPLAIEIAGWCTAADFAEYAEDMDFGHGARRGIKPRFLRRMWRP